ncbi:MAG: 2,3-bisphosphoglycerate-independent phosphoglycerate mutase [Candidatus Aminicenantes bacterium]|nr:2,3-bisphosphoglycerate-independent phosphoglycerate mutase [Candidatus Aminicenantes bacterium]
MEHEEILKNITIQTDSKILLLVMDGLGDLPINGKTALETAKTPHLDELAAQGTCGVTDPVFMGITPGSGPAHLSLFGYDPTKYLLGRGILEALGVGVEVGPNDLVARGNFASMKDGLIIDRRAGRIPTDVNADLCREINVSLSAIEEAEITLFPGKEHRFVVRFRKKGLDDQLTDADPQKENKPIPYTRPLYGEAEETARIVNSFIDKVSDILKHKDKANCVLLRGFSKYPSIPTMQELFKLKPAAIANYPMYKGLAKLVGMEILPAGPEIQDLFDTLEKHYKDFDFFYIHVKKTDSAGEDGDYKAKVKVIETTDSFIPRLLRLKPEVLAVTSDHSTPCLLEGHSWHPNPFMLNARTAMPDEVNAYTERMCRRGYFGRFQSLYAMPLMLAHAEKLKKYGA